jgi:NAD(P)-dependent dehydrogenase (short-subunit alcohol dehydrogenase family)
MPNPSRIVLVLGATGGIGGETAFALSRHGWKVRAFSRTSSSSPDLPGLEWLKGDALDRESVLAASEGVHAIVHAVNPPGYRNWAKLVLPMIDNQSPQRRQAARGFCSQVRSITMVLTPSRFSARNRRKMRRRTREGFASS